MVGQHAPDVSVVVSTYGRAALLPRLVAALEAQTFDPGRFEVVIADNGSLDETPQVLEDLRRASGLDLKVVRAEVNRGAAAGRNLAVRHAAGRVLAFTDDDCEPAPGWLEAGLAALGEDACFVVGRTEPTPGKEIGPFSRTQTVTDASHLQTCNIFYRRADVETAEGFDERFGLGGEDTDLGLRIMERGVEARYAPEALVHHDVSASSLRAALRRAAVWVDLPLVVRRHPQVRETHLYHRVFWKRSHPPTLLAVLGVALALRSPLALLLVVPWVRHRLLVEPLAPGRQARLASLPGAFAVDVTEVTAMVRGTMRHRTLLL